MISLARISSSAIRRRGGLTLRIASPFSSIHHLRQLSSSSSSSSSAFEAPPPDTPTPPLKFGYIHDAEQDKEEKGLHLLLDATMAIFELPLLEDVRYLKVPKFELLVFGSPSQKAQQIAEQHGTYGT
jgi:hypothetical protein